MVLTALLGLSAPLTATILSLQVVGLGIVLHLRVVEPASVSGEPPETGMTWTVETAR